MSALLFDERTIVVQPSLVRAVGSVTVAAVVQQIHYHAQAGHTREDGWVARTHTALGEEIGLTGEQVRRAVDKAKTLGILESIRPEGYQRTTWYRLIPDSPLLSDSSNRRNGRIESAELPLRIGAVAESSSTEVEKTIAPAEPARVDEIFDALCEVTNTDPAQLTKSGRGPLNRAVKELRALDATGPEIKRRWSALQHRYPQSALTAPALVKFWASLGNGRARAAPTGTVEDSQATYARLMEAP